MNSAHLWTPPAFSGFQGKWVSGLNYLYQAQHSLPPCGLQVPREVKGSGPQPQAKEGMKENYEIPDLLPGPTLYFLEGCGRQNSKDASRVPCPGCPVKHESGCCCEEILQMELTSWVSCPADNEIVWVGLASRVGPLKLECFHWLMREGEVRDIQDASRGFEAPRQLCFDGGATCQDQKAPAGSWEQLLANREPLLTVQWDRTSLNHKELSSANHLNEPGSTFFSRAPGWEQDLANTRTSAWWTLSREASATCPDFLTSTPAPPQDNEYYYCIIIIACCF